MPASIALPDQPSHNLCVSSEKMAPTVTNVVRAAARRGKFAIFLTSAALKMVSAVANMVSAAEKMVSAGANLVSAVEKMGSAAANMGCGAAKMVRAGMKMPGGALHASRAARESGCCAGRMPRPAAQILPSAALLPLADADMPAQSGRHATSCVSAGSPRPAEALGFEDSAPAYAANYDLATHRRDVDAPHL